MKNLSKVTCLVMGMLFVFPELSQAQVSLYSGIDNINNTPQDWSCMGTGFMGSRN